MSTSKGSATQFCFNGKSSLFLDLCGLMVGMFLGGVGGYLLTLGSRGSMLFGVACCLFSIGVVSTVIIHRLRWKDTSVSFDGKTIEFQFSRRKIVTVDINMVSKIFVGIDGDLVVRTTDDRLVVWNVLSDRKEQAKFVEVVRASIPSAEASDVQFDH